MTERSSRNRRLWRVALAVLVGLLVTAALVVELGGRFLVQGHSGGLPSALLPGERQLVHDTGTLSVLVQGGTAPERDTVFVLHGIARDRTRMAAFATALNADHHRVVLVDLPAHGRSSAGYVSFGVHEARALKAALDALERERATVGPVRVLGYSLGAACAIQWAGVDPRVRAVVALAPYRSLRAVAPGYARLFPEPIVQLAVTRGGWLAGFDPETASPERAITATTAPLLLVHGARDSNIPLAHSQAILAARPAHSQLVIVDHDHHSLPRDEAVIQTARRWLSEQASPTPATR